MSYFRPVEILVILLVIISTASLDFKTEESELEYLEVEYIEGTLDLKTRSSMDSLGLNDFKPGALVELNLNVNSITSECQICKNKPVGVLLSGEVNVSGLRPIDSGGQIRIEGNLNVTHLQEFSSKDMIIREWLTIDWDLDEFSAQWDIFIEHNPPKWSLDNRYDASLVDSGDATKSRVGPVIYLEEIIENSINIHGCMPNSLNCDGVNREEMNLTTKLTTQREPTNVVYSSNWTNYDVATANISDTQNIGDIRNLFEIEDSTTNHSAFCLENIGNIESVQSWNISGETSSSISPMGLWLSSIGLPSSSFTPTGGIWTEIDSEDAGCGAFSKSGKLYLGISKS
ncbi:MAG: hypothetical protein MK197_03015 [Candidatus Poseidoniaceae archaeon]|nr:hypothetical protein [Candidatus Poseidoniaceae archaeon]